MRCSEKEICQTNSLVLHLNISYCKVQTKREVKMAEYWPRSCFCKFMVRNGVEIHTLQSRQKPDDANIHLF